MQSIKPENIRLGVKAANKQEALDAVAAMAVELGYAKDKAGVVKGLEAREAQGTTGMEGGFAIPHVLGDVITTTGVIVLKLADDVGDWETFDGGPVNFVIALLAPASAVGNDHLKLLSNIAKMLIHEENRQALKAATSPEDIYNVIASKLD